MSAINLDRSRTVQLTIPQLTQIFEQLGYPGAKVAPYTQTSIQLEPFQIQSLGPAVALPTSPRSMSISQVTPGVTVESIISTTTPSPSVPTSRVNRDFIHHLADLLQISEKDFIDVLHDPTSGSIPEITIRLNDIFNGMIVPPLTGKEVQEMIMTTMPAAS